MMATRRGAAHQCACAVQIFALGFAESLYSAHQHGCRLSDCSKDSHTEHYQSTRDALNARPKRPNTERDPEAAATGAYDGGCHVPVP